MERNENGFTVIEVLLCVVIIATGIIAIFRPFLGAVSTLHHLDRRIEAANLLNQKIWEFQSATQESGQLTGGKTQGVLMGGEIAYHYHSQATRVDNSPRLFKVNFKATWNENGFGKSLLKDVYVLLPYKNPE